MHIDTNIDNRIIPIEVGDFEGGFVHKHNVCIKKINSILNISVILVEIKNL
jgi:hypothetical protein